MVADHEARWGQLFSAVTLGALVFTIVNSPGYYIERRDRPMTVLFVVLAVSAVPALVVRVLSA